MKTINLNDLPHDVQFFYLAATQLAIEFKKRGHDKISFVEFFEKIWNSMEMNDIEKLENTIQIRMKKDIETRLKNHKG